MKKLAVVLMSGIVFGACQKKEETTVTEETTVEETAPEAQPVASKECYLKVMGKDSMMFEMERSGDNVTGVFNWVPAEKDKKMSTYTGTLKGSQGTAIAEASAEGMTNKEELHFTVNETTVAVKMGNMVEGKDGVWTYDPANPASEQVLTKVDCKK